MDNSTSTGKFCRSQTTHTEGLWIYTPPDFRHLPDLSKCEEIIVEVNTERELVETTIRIHVGWPGGRMAFLHFPVLGHAPSGHRISDICSSHTNPSADLEPREVGEKWFPLGFLYWEKGSRTLHNNAMHSNAGFFCWAILISDAWIMNTGAGLIFMTPS